MAQPAAKAYHRTTVYLTDEQRHWLRRAAAKTQLAGLTVSASDVIRLALRACKNRSPKDSSTRSWPSTSLRRLSCTQDAPSADCQADRSLGAIGGRCLSIAQNRRFGRTRAVLMEWSRQEFVRTFSTISRPALRAAACGGRPRPAAGSGIANVNV